MKLKFTLTFLLFVNLIIAQNAISIAGGIKLVKNESKSVVFGYVDESPSHDNIYTEVKQKGKIAFQVNVRLQDNDSQKNHHFFVEGQGYLGSINGLALNGGLLYLSSGDSKMKFQPEIGAVIGYNTTPIGTMENNDVYIQVNDTKFKDYTNVDVSLRNIYYGLKPGINIIFDSNNTSKIGLGVHYQASLKMGEVAFKGKDANGDNVVETEKLGENNVSFYVDGSKTDKVPFNADGLEFRIFYQF